MFQDSRKEKEKPKTMRQEQRIAVVRRGSGSGRARREKAWHNPWGEKPNNFGPSLAASTVEPLYEFLARRNTHFETMIRRYVKPMRQDSDGICDLTYLC